MTPQFLEKQRPLAGFALANAVVAASSGRITHRALRPWYRKLKKPPFQPPGKVFGPVWTALYAMSALSGSRIYRAEPSDARTRALRLWGVQLVANGLWSRLFFGQKRTKLALVDIAALLATNIAYTRVARRVDRKAARLFVPYIAWVGFAAVLNEEIVRRNR